MAKLMLTLTRQETFKVLRKVTFGIINQRAHLTSNDHIISTRDHAKYKYRCKNAKSNDIFKDCNEKIEYNKSEWTKVLYDNRKHEATIAVEIEKQYEFNPNLPSLYRLELDPEFCYGVDTEFGQRLLASSLYKEQYGKIFLTLWPHFLTQANSLLCGPSSIVLVLNALKMDPQRQWKYPWRWYDEEMLTKCVPDEHTATNGCSMDVLMCMAKCNGLSVAAVRASMDWTEEDFREDVKRSCSSKDHPIILNFSRAALNQSGTGHFSPLGAYNEENDMVLVMDTARFKFPPFWTKLSTMWQAIQNTAIGLHQENSGLPRGYMILSKPEENQNAKTYLRLPWQQARVKLMTLSDDEKVLFPLYVLRKFSNHKMTLLKESNETNESILQKAVDEILKFTKNLNSNNQIHDDGDIPESWIHKFDFEEIKHTSTFRIIKHALSENYSESSLLALKKVAVTVCGLIELDNDDDEIPTKNRKKRENIEKRSRYHATCTKEEVDKLAQMISALIIFWPYSQENEGSNNAAMLKTIDVDKKLFSINRRQSVSQQVTFLLKALEHVGHEHVYKKSEN